MRFPQLASDTMMPYVQPSSDATIPFPCVDVPPARHLLPAVNANSVENLLRVLAPSRSSSIHRLRSPLIIFHPWSYERPLVLYTHGVVRMSRAGAHHHLQQSSRILQTRPSKINGKPQIRLSSVALCARKARLSHVYVEGCVPHIPLGRSAFSFPALGTAVMLFENRIPAPSNSLAVQVSGRCPILPQNAPCFFQAAQ